MTITPIQKMIITNSQRELNDPTGVPGVIMGSFNSLTSTAIYHYGDYRIWYRPMGGEWVVWRNEKFCFEFPWDVKIVDIIKRIDNE